MYASRLLISVTSAPFAGGPSLLPFSVDEA